MNVLPVSNKSLCSTRVYVHRIKFALLIWMNEVARSMVKVNILHHEMITLVSDGMSYICKKHLTQILLDNWSFSKEPCIIPSTAVKETDYALPRSGSLNEDQLCIHFAMSDKTGQVC